MPLYKLRHAPLAISAMQWQGDLHAMRQFLNLEVQKLPEDGILLIQTRVGGMLAARGWWIVKHPGNNIAIMRPRDFEERYVAVQ